MTTVPPPPPPAEDEPQELEGGFSKRLLGWVVGLSVVSFVVAILLVTYGDELEARKPNPHANTFSKSALGHMAAARYLQAMGLGVVSRQNPGVSGAGPSRPLIVAEPDAAWLAGDPAAKMEGLVKEAARRKAPLVLVLPKWAGQSKKGRPEWIGEVGLVPDEHLLGILAAFDDEVLADQEVIRGGDTSFRCQAPWRPSDWTKQIRVETSPPQLLDPHPDLHPVVRCPQGILVARHELEGGPEVWVISDPDVLNNQGLDRADNAVLLYELLTRELGATGVVFDETIHGFNRTPGLLTELRSFPLVLAVFQTLILAGIVLWAGIGRFGKPLPSGAGIAPGKDVLIDNTARLLAGGGHASDSLARYFRQTTRAVAAAQFLPPDLPEPEMLARLQHITVTRRIGMDLHSLERQIHQLPDGAAERAVKLARALHTWRLEMTNVHRQGS